MKDILKQFWKSRLNRISLIFISLFFLMAYLSPLLAGNIPLKMTVSGKTSYPVMHELFPFNHLLKPLVSVEYKKMILAEDDHLVFPPIPYSPTEYDLDEALEKPSVKHLMGTDEQGRDVLSRMIHGSKVSLSVGFVAVGLSLAIGIFLGGVAGYWGGRLDLLLSRLIEIMMCFPTFLFILPVITFLGSSLWNIMIVIGVTGWTGVARLVRGEFFKWRNYDFVTAQKALGGSSMRIMFKHILPNSLAPVMVAASFGVASAILTESSLSFLGFGVQPPTPSWGDILSQSREFMDIAWWLTIFPGVAIFLTVTMFNLMGEGIRDAIDPRMKG